MGLYKVTKTLRDMLQPNNGFEVSRCFCGAELRAFRRLMLEDWLLVSIYSYNQTIVRVCMSDIFVTIHNDKYVLGSTGTFGCGGGYRDVRSPEYVVLHRYFKERGIPMEG